MSCVKRESREARSRLERWHPVPAQPRPARVTLITALRKHRVAVAYAQTRVCACTRAHASGSRRLIGRGRVITIGRRTFEVSRRYDLRVGMIIASSALGIICVITGRLRGDSVKPLRERPGDRSHSLNSRSHALCIFTRKIAILSSRRKIVPRVSFPRSFSKRVAQHRNNDFHFHFPALRLTHYRDFPSGCICSRTTSTVRVLSIGVIIQINTMS